MPRHKQQEQSSLEISFAHQPSSTPQQDHKLHQQILRVQAIQKQRMHKHIWNLDQAQLCDYFTQYKLFPQNYLTIDMLMDSNKLKLIKSEGKIYFGQIDRKKRHGWGIQFDKNGQIYQGHFSHNEKRGKGVQIYSNSNLYIGQFMNNKKHGNGNFYWFNMSTRNPKGGDHIEHYEGQWWGGLPDGQGIHHRANGDQYIGTFKNGLKHGQGEQQYGNGDFYSGQFINGLPEGYGEYIWADSSSYRGDFKQGQRSGYGVWKASTNRMEGYQGHYTADKKQGYGIYTWDNGWTYRGNFDNDLRNGFGELFDSKDRIQYAGQWFNGDQIGKEQPKHGRYQQESSNPEFETESAQLRSTLYSRKGRERPFDNPQRYQSAHTLRRPYNRPQTGQYASLSNFAQQNLCKRPQKYTNSHNSSLQNNNIRIRLGQVGTKISRPLAPGPAAIMHRNRSVRRI